MKNTTKEVIKWIYYDYKNEKFLKPFRMYPIKSFKNLHYHPPQILCTNKHKSIHTANTLIYIFLTLSFNYSHLNISGPNNNNNNNDNSNNFTKRPLRILQL